MTRRVADGAFYGVAVLLLALLLTVVWRSHHHADQPTPAPSGPVYNI